MRQAGNRCHLATCSHGGRVPPLGRSPGTAEVWLKAAGCSWVGHCTGGVGYSLPSFPFVSFVRCPTRSFVLGLRYRNRMFFGVRRAAEASSLFAAHLATFLLNPELLLCCREWYPEFWVPLTTVLSLKTHSEQGKIWTLCWTKILHSFFFDGCAKISETPSIIPKFRNDSNADGDYRSRPRVAVWSENR